MTEISTISAPNPGSRASNDRRHQFGIAGLMIAVVVAAVSAAVLSPLRFSRPFSTPHGRGFDTLIRLIGVLLIPVAATLTAVLIGQAVGQRSRSQPLRSLAFPIAWRVLAVLALAVFLAEQAATFRFLEPFDRGIDPPSAWTLRWEVRLTLWPCCGAMLLIGLILATVPGRSRSTPQRRLLASWPSVLVAGLAGAAIVAVHLILGYLVLIAIECVGNAMMGAPHAARPSLETRILDMLPATAFAALACLVTASLVADDLRRASTGQGARRGSTWGLILGTGATAALAGILLLRVLPHFQPNLTEGLGVILGLREVAPIVIGFAALAAGIAARAIGRSADQRDAIAQPGFQHRRAIGRAGRWIVTAGLVALILVSWANLAERFAPIKRVTPPLIGSFFLEPIAGRTGEFWYALQRDQLLGAVLNEPTFWFPLVTSAWLLARTVTLCLGKNRGLPSPLDVVASTTSSARRFSLDWLALTTAMFAALPSLGIAGLSAVHFGLAALYP